MERGWPSGPRLPRKEPIGRLEDIEDPAQGERVPRCWSCGTPSLEESRLMLFALVLHGRAAGRWQLCERCWIRRNPPDRQAGDPLDASAA